MIKCPIFIKFSNSGPIFFEKVRNSEILRKNS